MPSEKYERDKAESMRKQFNITTGPDPSYVEFPRLKTVDLMDQVYHDIKSTYKDKHEERMDTREPEDTTITKNRVTII